MKEAPPFAFKDEQGRWVGLSVELWEEAAGSVGVSYEYSEQTLDDMFAGLQSGQNDAAIGALSITPEREEIVDFTHGYYRSGLGIAVPSEGGGGPFSFFAPLLTWQFASAVLTLLVVLAGVGAVIWLVERRQNPEEFGGTTAHGLGKGLWWSAVTMTTVGYGDKSPRTMAGRIVGLVWMFTSIIIIAGMTGALASAFTVSSLDGGIEGPDDLRGVRVAVVEGSSSAVWLEERNIRLREFPTAEAALAAVADGDLQAAVHDAPLARYLIENSDLADLRVLEPSFEHESYGFAFPTGSPMVERFNRATLRLTGGNDWEEMIEYYVGEENL
ncbi:transporter substrate-binding domain-containing protein [Aquisalinus luteolus]|uniref:transporter substrate-binding domain-containing protein n=1 Tax=Aquisalinus luteolus TaxID=1566827 RepID=UPI001E61E345|nr:transporter substrate-binding domain-containing protein [Aquisalinus luteolus]